MHAHMYTPKKNNLQSDSMLHLMTMYYCCDKAYDSFCLRYMTKFKNMLCLGIRICLCVLTYCL